MRTTGFALIWVAALGLVVGSQQREPGKTAGGSEQPRAEALLHDAREALGGESRLAAVATLVVEGASDGAAGPRPYGFRMRMPDRYQSLASPFTHTLDGTEFWMKEDASPLVTAVTDDMRDTARRSTISRFREHCLEFLLRWPSTFPLEPRAIGRTKIGGVEGDGAEFVSGSYSVRMVFDGTTHVPLAFAGYVTNSETGQKADRIVLLKDYRLVDGIRFPFLLEESIFGRSQTATKIESLKVNSVIGPGAFKKPSK